MRNQGKAVRVGGGPLIFLSENPEPWLTTNRKLCLFAKSRHIFDNLKARLPECDVQVGQEPAWPERRMCDRQCSSIPRACS